MKKILFVIGIPLIALLGIWSIPVVVAFKGTYYSSNFTKENFNKVEIGMTEDQAKTLLGEPLNQVESGGKKYLWYSASKNGSHFFVKELALKDSTVVEKVEEIYID